MDKYICGNTPYLWSPRFTYHGFRYVLVSGLSKPPRKGDYKAIFVHQDIKKISDFKCSDELINKLYDAGIRSSYSNMHYTLTDCPTREKLGWTNDAQGTLEQLYINFDIKRFFEKWEKEICVNMREDGSINGVIPNFGEFYTCGPVADGILFHLPYINYLYTGDSSMLCRMLPFMERYYSFYLKRSVDYWLGDWDGHNSRFKDNDFTFRLYSLKFCKTILLAQKLSGLDRSEKYLLEYDKAVRWIRENYILDNGYSKVENQTVISILLSIEELDKKPLIEQLKKCIEKDRYHITCGMWGLQYIYDALFSNDLGELAYKMITVKKKPSFNYWFQNGATTIWETWEDGNTDSRNHHMLSGVIAWFFKGFLGIYLSEDNSGYKHIKLKPSFIKKMEYCSGSIKTPFGKLSVAWERKNTNVTYRVTVPTGIKAECGGKILSSDENVFVLED